MLMAFPLGMCCFFYVCSSEVGGGNISCLMPGCICVRRFLQATWCCCCCLAQHIWSGNMMHRICSKLLFVTRVPFPAVYAGLGVSLN